jgi:excisionase family DNA binding protein
VNRYVKEIPLIKLFTAVYDYAVPVADYNLCVPVNRITAADAAVSLGVTKRRVIALIEAGKLKAEKIGNLYLIKPSDLDKVRDRKPGRPKKTP